MLVYLARDMARARSGAETGEGANDTVRVWENMPLLLVRVVSGAYLASSPFPMGRGFRQGLRQVQSLAIPLAGEVLKMGC